MSKPFQIAPSDAEAAAERRPPDGEAPTEPRSPTMPAPGRARPGAQARALLVAMRPRQWTKNVLVAAVPGAAGC